MTRLHNFFVEEKLHEPSGELLDGVPGKTTIISDPELIHQWREVLRLNTGDKVVILDNTGHEYVCKFAELSQPRAVLEVVEVHENKNIPSQEVFLFQSLIKKDKFEWVLEKGTELGVSRFMPILADRSEKKSLNFPRCKKIIIEASEQCGRGKLPSLYEVMKLEEAFGQYDAKAVVFHPDAPRFSKQEFIHEKSLAIFIGPEGGWSDREMGIFKEKQVPMYSFSSLTLRSETAAIAISSLILL